VNYGSVTIKGFTSKTIVIGKQEWTAERFGAYGGNEGYYRQEAAYYQLPLTEGWRIATVADFNKLTANVSTKKDANGNYYADVSDDLQRFMLPDHDNASNAFHFNAEKRGYSYQFGGDNVKERGRSAYFMTANMGGDIQENDLWMYKLDKTYAGVVRMKSGNPYPLAASLRFVRDLK
jgi:uncharacterized protein (TIGR02145 family)